MKTRLIRFLLIPSTIAIALGIHWAYETYEDHRLRELSQMVANDINDPEIIVRYIEHTLVLEGTAADLATQHRAQSIAKAYLTGFHIRNLWQKPELLDLTVVKDSELRTASLE